jgi:hypothetical protein
VRGGGQGAARREAAPVGDDHRDGGLVSRLLDARDRPTNVGGNAMREWLRQVAETRQAVVVSVTFVIIVFTFLFLVELLV